MRFGRLEIKAIAARILAEHRLELAPGYRLIVRQTPTLGPRHGMPVRVRAGAPVAGMTRAGLVHAPGGRNVRPASTGSE